jgi:thiamine pyrophosphokinase
MEGVFFMKQAIVFANGKMEFPFTLASYIQTTPVIIAVDGGIHNCLSLGFQPNILIGDLDSIGVEELNIYLENGVDIIRYPTHKDETDLELALQHTIMLGINAVLILGGLGARWDMTIANILLISNPVYKDMNIKFLDGDQELFILNAGDVSRILGQVGDTLSLIPLLGDVKGIQTHGLEYPLNNEILEFGTARGVSNVLNFEQVQVFFQEGLLCCVHRKAVNIWASKESETK